MPIGVIVDPSNEGKSDALDTALLGSIIASEVVGVSRVLGRSCLGPAELPAISDIADVFMTTAAGILLAAVQGCVITPDCSEPADFRSSFIVCVFLEIVENEDG